MAGPLDRSRPFVWVLGFVRSRGTEAIYLTRRGCRGID
jgi:hypothetical protein